MTKAMKLYNIPILVLLVLALSLGGCQITGNTKTTMPVPTKTDVPTLTQDEVCAVIYNYFEDRVSLVSSITSRQSLLTTLAKARPYFTATYQRNGRWQVSALGYGQKDEDWFFYYSGGLWNLYEASKTIEPANDKATSLSLYIARLTKTSNSTTGNTNMPPTSPSQSSQRQYYLRQAEYYQDSANSNLNSANMALSSANFYLRMSRTGTMYDYNMRQYQWEMERYQRYMKQYADDQQLANEYLIKAQHEP